MNKILLAATLLIATSLSAQTYFEDNFSGAITDHWTLHDEDGDGNNWAIYNSQDQGKVARSDSYINNVGPLTPNNWMVSEAIDLSGATGTVFLTWKVKAQSQSYANERYSVYVGTTDDISAMETNGSDFSEVVGTTNDQYVTRAVNVSSFNGQSIYVAFRHHNVTNEFALNIDDVKVSVPSVTNDLQLTSIDVNKSIVGDRVFTIKVTNMGGNLVTAFDLDWSFDGGSVITENVTGINLSYTETHTITIPVNGISQGSKSFTAEITTSDENPGNNSDSETYVFATPVIQFTSTDSDGNSFDLFDHLQSGQAIILDFMASWCGPCQSSTPELSELVENNGSGNGNLQALAITVESGDNASVLNGLNWNGGFYEYPKFPYNAANNAQYYHYAIKHNFNPSPSGIPFFIMICPDVDNPEMSTIIKHNVGYGGSTFNSYPAALNQCPTATLDLITLPNSISNFNLYPNPATNVVNVDFGIQNENNVTVSLMNTVGQTVVSKNMKAATGQQSVQFNTANLEAGIYLVKIKTQNGEQVKRVSVMK